MRRCSIVIFLVALLTLAPGTMAAAQTVAAPTVVGIAGYEIFPGVRIGPVVYGTSFAGTSLEDSGKWAASVNYTGTAGIVAGSPNSVTILKGSWMWRTGSGAFRFGRVLGGSVTWPPSLEASVGGGGCGTGIAAFSASLSVRFSVVPSGSIVGCLDDTHPATVFPPTLVGILTLP